MKNINLIPRTPLFQKIYLPIVFVTLGIAVISAVSLFFYGGQLQNGLKETDTRIKQLRASLQAVDQQKTTDQQTKDYQQLSSEVAQLSGERRIWMDVVDVITSQLPQVARITSMGLIPTENIEVQANAASQPKTDGSSASDQHISLSAEFGDLADVSDYVIRLQQAVFAQEVTVKSIQRIDGQIQAEAQPAAEPSAPIGLPSAPSVNPPDYAGNLEKSLPPAETQGDALLNELRWTVNRQMLSQQFGVSVPDKSFNAPNNVPSASGANPADPTAGGSAITPKEINDARKQLEQFKQQNNSPDGISSSSAAEPAAGSSSGSRPSAKAFTKYQVQLEFTLKPAGKDK